MADPPTECPSGPVAAPGPCPLRSGAGRVRNLRAMGADKFDRERNDFDRWTAAGGTDEEAAAALQAEVARRS